MTALEILEKYRTYIRYDENQTRFNLNDQSYLLHKAGEQIGNIIKNFDTTGNMAVIYAKSIYIKTISRARVNLKDLLANEEAYREEKEMYAIFMSEDMRNIENLYINALQEAVKGITGRSFIGDRDKESEKKIVFDAIEGVANQLGSCKEDVYVNSGKPVGKVTSIWTKILVFNYMAQCLLAIEEAPDNTAYLCYISNNGTADGYFAIVIKTNGNIFSVNDRVDEAYIGQHGNSRNGRWAEGHKDNIFPYDYVLEYAGHDYLGFATKYSIQESELEFGKFEPDAYLPVLLSILCIINSRQGRTLDPKKQVYMNTLMKRNISSSEEKYALIEKDQMGLIESNTQVLESIVFDKEKLLDGTYYREFGKFSHNEAWANNKQYLVDLYGQDYEPKKDLLTRCATSELKEEEKEKTLRNSTSKEIAAKDESTEVYAEFVGSLDRMMQQAYYETRVDQAKHIRENAREAIEAIGGIEAILKWYKEAVQSNIEGVYELISQYLKYKFGNKIIKSDELFMKVNSKLPDWMHMIRIETDKRVSSEYGHYDRPNILNKRTDKPNYTCPITGETANVWIDIKPRNQEEIELIIGKPVIPIMEHWKDPSYGTRDYHGNPILDVVDAIQMIPHPIEMDRKAENRDKFKVSIGFSKRGINKLKRL